MRKIKVSGCLNCPYRIGRHDVNPMCEHPSFGVKSITPTIPIKYCEGLMNGVEHTMCPEEYMPNWCPLESDNVICISQQIKC